MDVIVDLAIIGGGINGCGIAADASLRGLSVMLIEKDDIASKTSSSSTKLIHGGLRYLEHYDFSLVKKALNERQTLLEIAPHLVHPLSIVLPYKKSLRPAWWLRVGLFLYDNLSRKNTLPKSRYIKRIKAPLYFLPLSEEFNKGFLFYDCVTNDARLTIANALQAKEHGASILPNTALIKAETKAGLWHLTVKPKHGDSYLVMARSVINATGPWVEHTNELLSIHTQCAMSLVKGSHLVVDKLYDGDHAYLLQNDDKRIVFVVPYYGFSMIGTTEILFHDNLDTVVISPEEITYLFTLVEKQFNCKLSLNHIINSWSGIRPLLAEKERAPQVLSRDYECHLSIKPAPAISIYGGKITVYRQLASDAVDQLKILFSQLGDTLTNRTLLPGAFLGEMPYASYIPYAQEKYYWLDPDILNRLLHTYGTKTEQVLMHCKNRADLGRDFGFGLYQQEVDYLINEEWATTCEDILWRRTKLGLYFSEDRCRLLANYLFDNLPISTAKASITSV